MKYIKLFEGKNDMNIINSIAYIKNVNNINNDTYEHYLTIYRTLS